MSANFIKAEVDKIFTEFSSDKSKAAAMSAAWVLGNFKGINLKVMDMNGTSSVASYYVLGTASNTTQSNSIANEIIHQLRDREIEIISKEGMSGSDWILIDTGSVIVHIFHEGSREAYGLEELWSGATSVEIPHSYYFSSDHEVAAGSSTDDKGRDFF